MRKKNTKKSAKKTGFMRSRTLFFLFLLSVGVVLGYAGYRHARAATAPTVQFVVFCPDEPGYCHMSRSRVDAIARNVHHWYRGQLGGKTFRLDKTIKVTGTHSASWYNNGNSDVPNNVWDNIASEGKVQYSDNKIAIVILGWNGFGNSFACGLTDLVQHMGVIDPFVQFQYHGSTKTCRGTSYVKETFAHELGHAFGLNHRCDSSIMAGPTDANPNCDTSVCGGTALSKCSFASTQRSFLLNNRSAWFTSSASTVSSGSNYNQPADSDLDQPYEL
jgi:hypothetical protein